MNCKKGLVYTMAVFFIAVVIFELVSYSISHQDRQLESFLPVQDGQILAYRLDSISQSAASSLGINAQMERNSTALNFSVQDALFPLADSADGKVFVSSFKNFSERNFSSLTNCPLSLNVSIPNEYGIVLQTTGGIQYVQNNSNLGNDSAFLSIPNANATNGLNITFIGANIYCTAPAGATSYSFDGWANDGAYADSEFYFSDSLGSIYSGSALFDAGADHFFSAKYFDSSDPANWMETLHVDWIRPNYTLFVWGEVNSTYAPALTKQNVSCAWNISAGMNYTNSVQEALFIPINATLSCQNASYFGPLVLSKK